MTHDYGHESSQAGSSPVGHHDELLATKLWYPNIVQQERND